jgi:hypothetical protein
MEETIMILLFPLIVNAVKWLVDFLVYWWRNR